MAHREAKGFVRRLQRISAVIAIAPTLALPSSQVAAQTPQEVQRLAEQAIRRLGLQTDLPVAPEPFRFALTLPVEIVWIAIVVAIAVMLYTFRDLIPILRSQRSEDWATDKAGHGDGKAGAPAVALGVADRLAAEGRFVEAMHVLLLQALAAIRVGLDEQFADSLTSREILRSIRLPEAGRVSLRDIINRVELSYFGQHPAALADYVACRTSFNALTLALHGRAPA